VASMLSLPNGAFVWRYFSSAVRSNQYRAYCRLEDAALRQRKNRNLFREGKEWSAAAFNSSIRRSPFEQLEVASSSPHRIGQNCILGIGRPQPQAAGHIPSSPVAARHGRHGTDRPTLIAGACLR
jgi:hypothetical protein